jgi:hypothetical protein
METQHHSTISKAKGLTKEQKALRLEFAKAAMAAIISKHPPVTNEGAGEIYEQVAVGSFAYADAMMKEMIK